MNIKFDLGTFNCFNTPKTPSRLSTAPFNCSPNIYINYYRLG